MKAINTIGLLIAAAAIVLQIMSAPVPTAHTSRECIPLGEDYSYEVVGDWTIRE